MQIDSANWLDPLIFSVGFCLVASGITLTQLHVDDYAEGSPKGFQKPTNPILFWINRKVTSAALIVGAILGFWVVGWSWAIIGVLMALLGAVLVNLSAVRSRALLPVYALCLIGTLMIAWAQSPTLKHWGFLP